ncbi:DoxX family protein [Singulisphaera sp. PoT]|uniref:DoxX family protein n=1 Tax=Singulisphaera sp. PoT TaxID=3411797 RepID=UPI003BF604E3
MQLSTHYNLTQEQQQKTKPLLDKANEEAMIWHQDKEQTEKRNQYIRDLVQVQKTEKKPGALSFELERAYAKRKDLDGDRKKLIEPFKAIEARLVEGVTNIANPDQREAAGPYKAPKTSIDWVNLSTMWGLVAMGTCLILGFFTPLAALAGAVFLGQIYMSMPPWPGMPPNPLAEGHYFIVNKNLIEMLACLFIACTPSGHWIGLDALLFGKGRRRREQAREEAEAEAYAQAR